MWGEAKRRRVVPAVLAGGSAHTNGATPQVDRHEYLNAAPRFQEGKPQATHMTHRTLPVEQSEDHGAASSGVLRIHALDPGALGEGALQGCKRGCGHAGLAPRRRHHQGVVQGSLRVPVGCNARTHAAGSE